MGALLAGETAIATAKAAGAASDVVKGSAYLGPGAIAVGAAAFAALMGYLAYSGVSSAMSGGEDASSGIETGGGGGASTEIPSTGMNTTPTAPAPSTASTSTSYTPSGTNVSSGDGKGMGDVYIDGSKVGQIIFKNANQQQLNVV